jgi:hypothetical protein
MAPPWVACPAAASQPEFLDESRFFVDTPAFPDFLQGTCEMARRYCAREDLFAFPNQCRGHRFVYEAMCPIGGVFRPQRPFESALVPIGGVFHPVKGVDDGLLLLMIEGVGLAKHHILKYLRLCFGHEGKVIAIG